MPWEDSPQLMRKPAQVGSRLAAIHEHWKPSRFANGLASEWRLNEA
jgi:hypothetical protein